MIFSHFERAVIDALTWRVRVMSREQLAELGSLMGVASVRRKIHRLLSFGYIAQVDCAAHTVSLEKPLATWDADDLDMPDFGQVCWQAKARTNGDGSTTISKVFIAAKRAETEFGGCGGKLRQPLQINHDLGTTSVFLAKVEFFGWEDCHDWTSEDILRRHYRHLNIEKIPDAAFVSNERIGCVIDFVGRDYSPMSLRKFHHHWSRRQIPYEVW